jgi:hypothetical protein
LEVEKVESFGRPGLTKSWVSGFAAEHRVEERDLLLAIRGGVERWGERHRRQDRGSGERARRREEGDEGSGAQEGAATINGSGNWRLLGSGTERVFMHRRAVWADSI